MRDRFQEYAKIFNAYAEKNSGFQEVKIFSLAQSAADFMLFRKQMKLVVSNAAHGVIQLHFSQHLRTTMSVNGQEQYSGGKSTGPVVSSAPTASSESLASNPANELLAQIGPFRDVYWTFHGEKVSSEQVSKFYFSDFVRLTRDSGRSKGGNELLLHQIKTLLEEKGFNL